MTSDQLDTIIDDAAPTFPARLLELREHIYTAALEAIAGREEGDKPKVTVTLKLVIGLNTDPPWWQTTGAVGIAYKTEGAPVTLDNPQQPELTGLTVIPKSQKAKP